MHADQIAEKMTKATGNRLDFFNIGGLARQRTQETLWGLWNNYSWRELFIRGGIIVATAVGGLMAANTCEDEQCSSLSRGIVGAGTGFFVSHAVAVWPTIQRRNKIKADTLEFKNSIESQLDELRQQFNPESSHFSSTVQIIRSVTNISQHILDLSLPITKKGDAVRNLITIKNLIRKIDEKVKELNNSLKEAKPKRVPQLLEKAVNFWKQDLNTLKEQLTQTQQAKIDSVSDHSTTNRSF